MIADDTGYFQSIDCLPSYHVPKPYITNYDASSQWIDVPSGLVGLKLERLEEPTQEEFDMLMNEVPD